MRSSVVAVFVVIASLVASAVPASAAATLSVSERCLERVADRDGDANWHQPGELQAFEAVFTGAQPVADYYVIAEPKPVQTFEIYFNYGYTLSDLSGGGTVSVDTSTAPRPVPLDATSVFVTLRDADLTLIAMVEVAMCPTSDEQCKARGWEDYRIFKNQGDCVSFVASKGTNPGAG